MDVAKNAVVASKHVEIPNESDSKADDALRKAISQIKLNRFGIKKEAELGLDLLWRNPADTGPAEPLRFSFEEPGHGGATASGGGVVIAVSYQRPSFEGPDTRYLVVTGKAGPQP